MEDIRIGRASVRKLTVTAGAATPQKIVDRNPRRIGLQIFAHRTTPYTIGFDNSITFDNGPTLAAGGVPLQMGIAEYGQCVTEEWWGVATAGGFNIAVVETVLLEENMEKERK